MKEALESLQQDLKEAQNEVAGVHGPLTLTGDQQHALAAAASWYKRHKAPNFLLDGAAGTGKTYCLQALLSELDTNFVLFAAPTNKAVKVLSQTLAQSGIHSPCMTIYSALGLKMMPSGDVKELTTGDNGKGKVNWDKYQLVVLDEASMVGQILLPHITRVQHQYGVRFMYVGDFAQLPPVGEARSAVMEGEWEAGTRASLLEVVRAKNQILTLATAVRAQVEAFIPRVKLVNNNDGLEGVWQYASPTLADKAILAALDNGLFSLPAGAKCIAWRNVIVNKLNQMIREHLYPDTQQFFVEGDRVIVTEPFQPLVPDTCGEHEESCFITTDSEGRVESAELCPHPWYPDFLCWQLHVIGDDSQQFTAFVLHEDARMQRKWKAHKDALAAAARLENRKWKAFWEFVEAFHGIRHGYAITAHRSQGSTYQQAFVNHSDILLNQNRTEAFRCLYVACSRPREQLHLW